MDKAVQEKLNQRCNFDTLSVIMPVENYLDFIRSSEYEFRMEEKSFERITIEKLNEYIDFLDYLWTK